MNHKVNREEITMTTDSKVRPTPGPWKIGQSEAPHEVYGSNSMVARCYGHSGDNKHFWEIAQANACLIAAAPELLGALEYCELVMTLATTCCGGIAEEVSAIQKARAAIMKAKGEPVLAV
jgi:hypothetical protein